MKNRIQSDEPILAFAHIPKTAGTTLTLLLRQHFGTRLMSAKCRPSSRWNSYRYVDLLTDLSVYPRVRCIAGHALKPFANFREFDSRLQWFTFIREPYARFISHYVHQQTGKHDLHKLDLNAWAKKFQRSNWITRMIAGEEDVEAAKQIIMQKRILICLTDHFQESLQHLCSAYELRNFNTDSSRNLMVTRSNALKEQIKANYTTYQETVEANNALDKQLYDYARTEIWPMQQEEFKQTEFSLKPAKQNSVSQLYNRIAYQVKDKFIYAPFVRATSRQSEHFSAR